MPCASFCIPDSEARFEDSGAVATILCKWAPGFALAFRAPPGFHFSLREGDHRTIAAGGAWIERAGRDPGAGAPRPAATGTAALCTLQPQ
jgi:hypothetical protein